MALTILFATGFENGKTGTAPGEGSLTGGGNGITTGAARSGTYGLNVDSNDYWTNDDISMDMTKAWYYGFAMKPISIAGNGSLASILELDGVNYINLWGLSDGDLLIGKANGQNAEPDPGYSCGAFTYGAWHYIEIACVIHNTTGAIKVKVDGVLTLDVSGIDTQDSATATDGTDTGRFRLQAPAVDTYFDDVVIAEGSSTTLEFIGEVSVLPGRPTSAVVSDMTGSDANQTDNHLLVDEAPTDTADYVESATIGHQDTYGTDMAVPSGATVVGMKVAAYALMDDSGPKGMGLYIKEGTTETTSAGIALTEAGAILSEIWETNPDTASAWTIAEADAAEIGVEITS